MNTPSLVEKVYGANRSRKVVTTFLFLLVFGSLGIYFLTGSHAATPPNCSPNAILVNPCRPLIGAAVNGNSGAPSGGASQLSYFEQLTGNQMDVYRDYHAPVGTVGNSNASLPLDPNTKEGQTEIQIANSGKILDLNWDVTHTWKQAMPVNQGGDPTINSQIDQAAANIKKLPHKVFLSPWHEANLHIGATDSSSEQCSHFNNNSPNGTPAQFVAAWQNIYNHFKNDGVTNVVWVLNYGSYPPNDCWIPYMWPGNNEVDWVIVDTYSEHKTWDQTAGNFYTNVLQADNTKTRNYESKPWGIGEFGDCNATDPSQAYDYFNSITAAVKANTYPKFKMYLMFADTGNGAGPGCLSNYDPNGAHDQQKEQDVNAMFDAIVKPGTSTNPTPSISITSPHAGATVSGAVTVTASATVSTGSISSVVLKANGKVLKSCSNTGSCSASWDTKTLANGSYVLEADTTASGGGTNKQMLNVKVNNQKVSSCQPNATLVNPCRPWFGAAVSGIPGAGGSQQAQYSYLESQIGHNLDTYRQYSACGSDGTGGITCKHGFPFAPGSDGVYFATHGKIVDLNWKPYTDFADADGRNATVNAEIAQAAKNIAAVAPNKVMLTIWWEPQTSTNSYNGCANSYPNSTGGSAAEYDLMWKNVQNIFSQQHVTNVVWAADYLSTGDTDFYCQVPQLWPGNAGADVNWVLFDVYGTDNHPTWETATGRLYGYLTHLVSSNPSMAIASKPWGIGEFGTCGNNQGLQSEVKYFSQAKQDYQNNVYPNLKLYQIWDDNINGNGGENCLTGYYNAGTKTNPVIKASSQKQDAFNAFANAVLTTGSSGAPVPTVSIDTPQHGATVKGNAVSVIATAGVSSGSITNITLIAGGSTLATCNTSPCATIWDTTGLMNGSASVEADVTASDGQTTTATETVTVKNPKPVTITAPTYVVSPSQTTSSIALEWKASSDSKYASSQLSYIVYRNGNKVGSTAAGVTSYTDANLASGTTYSYTMSATDPAGHTSEQSTPFTQATQQPPCTPPAAPAGFTGSALTPSSAKLRWQPVLSTSTTCHVAYYVIERDGATIAQSTSATYTDTALSAGTTYSYSVFAELVGNIPGASSTISITTPKPPTDPGPTPPADLHAFPFGYGQVVLWWQPSTDKVSGIKYYEVLRNGKYLATTRFSAYGDTGLQPNTTYAYQVIAVSGNNKLAASKSVKVRTYIGCFPGWTKTLECRVPPGY